MVGCAGPVAVDDAPATRPSTEPPVLVIGGWGDPGMATSVATSKLRRKLPGWAFVKTNPGFASDMNRAARVVVEAIEKVSPSDDEAETVEVDVVAVSMGGLAARLAATSGDGRKRLKIRRLYTIVSPHSGAILADRAGFFGSGRQMRSGSVFLQELAERELDSDETFPIVAYARDGDVTIGDRGAKLPDHLTARGTLIWLPIRFWQTGHTGAFADERILSDIARRLADPPP